MALTDASGAPSKISIYLYQPSTPYSFPIDELKIYLEELLKGKLAPDGVQVRPEYIINFIITQDDLDVKKQAAEELACCRIEDIKKQTLPADEDYKLRVFYSAMEMNLLEGIPPDRTKDFLYFGPRMMSVFRKYIPEEVRSARHIHIIFTDRLFCSWDDSDARYHARAVMMGFPHLISMPGIVEAPARPREYYIKRHLYASAGLSLDELEAEFAGQYLIYKDQRTLEVIKGYSLQTLFYTLFAEQFCEDNRCRLFNAHWQSELLSAQIESGKLCSFHQEMLKSWIDED